MSRTIQNISEYELLLKKLEKEGKDLIEAQLISHKAREDLEYIASHDEYTGLPNRRYFNNELQSQIKYSREEKTKLALLMLDIEGRRYINYSLGYEIGNKVMIEVVNRLRRFLGQEIFLSRFSDDNFAIIVEGEKSKVEYDSLANGIIKIFKDSFVIDNLYLDLSVNIGICIYNGIEDEEYFRRNTKLALYNSKKEGKNLYKYYSSDLNVGNYKETSLRSDLHNAIEKNQLRVFYQPIMNLNNYEILAAEALLRWEHPEWGTVSPGEFIPLAEETELILDISKWILREVFKNYKNWKDHGLPNIKVSINFPSVQFSQVDFIDNVELGVQVALDDFGKGYSSLFRLTSLKIDILKLDGFLIDNISKESHRVIIKHIVNMANELKIKLVGEGIERVEQLTALQEFKCFAGQGYIFSRPKSLKDFEKIMKGRKIKPNIVGGDSIRAKDKRKYFRVKFNQLLEGNLTIKEIGGKRLNIGNTKVLIRNIGPGGLSFISNISFPLDKDFVLEFHTELLNQEISIHGKLVWTDEIENKLHRYGVEFIIDEDERSDLVKILNRVQIKMKNDILFAEGNFISYSPTIFFNRPLH